ncbi:MAG: 2-amino-4-hydroxy-6-hydroxymethyldihydropteridine diphosphokinase [bacterium]|jgi:2-amino-4-hydroxy-6-hydroxymethyldihydropteridine diphosphokinase
MKALILLGSNQSNPKEQLKLANVRIAEIAMIERASALYKTAAWGKTDQDDFYNQAIIIDTKLDADELMLALLAIERSMGRERLEKWSARIIDIDIILIDGLIHESEVLSVPHPHMQSRRFVLAPSEEIAAEMIHPIYQKNIKTLLAECNDELMVEKIM